MAFLNTRPFSKTPSGLPVAPLSTSFAMSDYFKNRPSKCYISPDEVILCVDNRQNMYWKLLFYISPDEVKVLDSVIKFSFENYCFCGFDFDNTTKASKLCTYEYKFWSKTRPNYNKLQCMSPHTTEGANSLDEMVG